jgi:putative transposase
MENKIPLESEYYYHIYNHANGFDDFFKDQSDYQNFIYRYIKYIVPICNTFAYCLMPNYFHFFVQIKSELELKKNLKTNMDTLKVDSETISYRFAHFFNGYVQSYNKKYKRMGSLFKSNFDRKPVTTEKYFVKLVHYIHSNPVNDGFVEKIEQWEYSSYNIILSDSKTFLNRNLVIDYFGDKNNLKFVHQRPFNLE